MALEDRVAARDGDRADDAADARLDHVLHLHGFHDQQLVAGAHHLAFAHRHADDRALHGGRDRNRVLGRCRLGHALAVAALRRSGPRRPTGRARLLPRARTASGSSGSTRAPSRRGEAARLEEQAPVRRRVRPEQLARVLLDEARVMRPARSSGWRSRLWRKAALVGTPAILNSQSARYALAATAVRVAEGEETISLASSESNRGLGPVAGIAERVDADARPRRRLEGGERPAGRARGAVGRHRLHVDAHLHRHAARPGHLAVAEPERGQRLARGQRELEPDEVEAGHLLGHRVLHLQARVGLDEGEGRVLVAVSVDEELHGAEIVETGRAGQRHRRLEQPLAHPDAEPGRRRDLDQLLALALDAALALPEVADRRRTDRRRPGPRCGGRAGRGAPRRRRRCRTPGAPPTGTARTPPRARRRRRRAACRARRRRQWP